MLLYLYSKPVMNRFAYLFSLLLLLWTVTPIVRAADFIATPLALNFNVERRDIIKETITLTNNTSQQVRLYASVNEVATDGNGVLERFLEPSQVDRSNTPTAWVEFTRGRIELAPGEKKDFPVTIRMNPDTAPGDYSVFLGFAQASNQPEAVQKIIAGNGQGTLINLTVDKKQDQFLKLTRFLVERFITGQKAGKVTIALQNPSHVDVVPQGEIIFYDTRGNEVGAVPVNEAGIKVEREGEATLETTVPESLRFGKYKAFLSLSYGEHLTASLNDTSFFYVLPLWQIVTAFVAVLIVAVLLALYIHRRYDVGDDDGSDPVSMYRRSGTSNEIHHDINLKQK